MAAALSPAEAASSSGHSAEAGNRGSQPTTSRAAGEHDGRQDRGSEGMRNNNGGQSGIYTNSQQPLNGAGRRQSARGRDVRQEQDRGRRRTSTERNANHLLNFQYERPQQRPAARRPVRQVRRAYDKDLFLQANFRFLVSDIADYADCLLNADRMPDWDDIVEITPCGHVFCLACILRHLRMGGGDWNKCPLCFTLISSKDLRSMSITSVQGFTVGSKVRFQLLVRKKGLAIPFPVDELEEHVERAAQSSKNGSRETLTCPRTVDGQCALFSKLTVTDSEAQLFSTEAERLEKYAQAAVYSGREDVSNVPYLHAAVDALKSRSRWWSERRTMHMQGTLEYPTGIPVRTSAHIVTVPIKPNAQPSAAADIPDAIPEQVGTPDDWEGVYLDASGDEGLLDNDNDLASREDPVDGLSDDLATPSEVEAAGVSLNPAAKPFTPKPAEPQPELQDQFRFYQAADGQRLVLHPLNVKCLLEHYSSYAKFPPTLEATILEMEPQVQSEATRRRYRYLSHLPLTSSFQLCEVDLSGVLPDTALQSFKTEIRSRDQRRRRHAQRERQREEHALHMELQERLARAPPSPSDFVAAMAATRALQLEQEQMPPDAFPEAAPHEAVAGSSPATPGMPSFSRVARMGYASGASAPVLIPATQAASPPSLQGVWAQPVNPSSIGSSGGGSMSGTSPAQSHPQQAGSTSSGKKGKKTTLFTIATARRY
eukprot:jgi/Chlat1/3782/Chrsp259S03946